MNLDTQLLDSTDGIKINFARAKVDSPKGAILFVHGYAEHLGRYLAFVEFLNQEGYEVFLYDWRGHGKSTGERCFIKDRQELFEDYQVALQEVSKYHKDFFVFGHSTGAGLIVHQAIHSPHSAIKGMILSAPTLRIEVSSFLKTISTFIAKVAPRLPVADSAPLNLLSRDPAIEAAARNDPLMYKGKVKASLGLQILLMAREARHRIGEISLPFFLAHGGNDQIVELIGSKEMYANAASPDKTFKVYEGFYHEITNEIEKMQYYNDCKDWLQSQLQK